MGLRSSHTFSPAGQSFDVDIAGNRGVTSWSFNGQYATEWTDGQPHPGSGSTLTQAAYSSEGCITTPNSKWVLFTACSTVLIIWEVHTQSEAKAAGTAFAISYQASIVLLTSLFDP